MLEKIWSAPGISFAERKQRLVAVWDEQPEDEVGQVGRALIARFIRERCQIGSACAFSDEELRAINAAFSPYAR